MKSFILFSRFRKNKRNNGKSTTTTNRLWCNDNKRNSSNSNININELNIINCRKYGLSNNCIKNRSKNKKNTLKIIYNKLSKNKNIKKVDKSSTISSTNTSINYQRLDNLNTDNNTELTNIGYLQLLNPNFLMIDQKMFNNYPDLNDENNHHHNEHQNQQSLVSLNKLSSSFRMRIGMLFNKKQQHIDTSKSSSSTSEIEAIPGPSDTSKFLSSVSAKIKDNKKTRTRKSSRNATFCPLFSQSISSSDDEDDVATNTISVNNRLNNKFLISDAIISSLNTVISNPELGTPTERATLAIHSTIEYKNVLVPDLNEITSSNYYWGMMDRYEAENLLDGQSEGSFILRDSAQINYLFSVSFRRYSKTLHARIEYLNGLYSFDMHDDKAYKSKSIIDLIDHYKDLNICWIYEPTLSKPFKRNFVFSLKHLCRTVIVSQTTYEKISFLPLPPMSKKYLREYHYKQPVRITDHDI